MPSIPLIGSRVWGYAGWLDFRQKAIQAIELDRLKKGKASELFNISRNTINLWLQRKAAKSPSTMANCAESVVA